MNLPENNQPAGKLNPYKGLHPYTEEDKDSFSGRQKDAEGLLDRIKNKPLTVVFGKSGIGKSSLLNAGLFPKLKEKDFQPIRIRLNYANDSPPIMQQINQTILDIIDDPENPIQLKSKADNKPAKYENQTETLWEHFHRFNHFDSSKGKEKIVTPVLVLDQFEEIFTLSKNNQERERIINELRWLIRNQIPKPYEKHIKKMNIAHRKKPDVRVVISLREDYLPHLTEIKTRISTPKGVADFRVNHLNGEQTRDIIKIGFKKDNVINDILHCFYPEKIRDEKGTILDDKNVEIEPALLSLLCQRLFDKQPLESIKLIELDKILEDFYASEMNRFPDEVNQFIEEKLLTEGGYRTPIYLESNHPLRSSLHQLVDRRILRRFHTGEKENIEIIHDVLTPIIREKRNKRLDKIREQEVKKKLTRRFYRITIGIISSIAIIATIIAVYALYQKNIADERLNDVKELKVISKALMEQPKDNTRAIRIAGKAYEMGSPQPMEHTSQVLGAVGYSSFEQPFYITAVEHKSPIYSAAFSPDGSLFITASEDGTAKLWDLKGNIKTKLNKHKNRIVSVQFSPDGRYILTASWDKTARLWDLQGKPMAVFNEHTGPVTSAIFSRDGTRVLTASRDGTAKLWDKDGNLQPNLFNHTAPVSSAMFSPDGSRILTASWDKTAVLWDLKGNSLLNIEHNNAIASAIFSPDGSKILTASWDNTAKLWDLQGESLVEFNGHKGAVISAVFSSEGNQILTASRDNTAKLWDLNGDVLANLKHNDELSSAAFSGNGRYIVTGSRDGIVKLWDKEGTLLKEFKKFNGIVYSAAFAANENWLLTACEDGTAAVWVLDSNLLVDLDKHSADVNSAVFSPDNNFIITASRDHTAKLWDLAGNLLADLKHKGMVTSAVFSPDGKLVLTASADNTAKLWDLKGKLKANLNKHKDVITSAVFSPDGQKILTASEDSTARVWDLHGNLLTNLRRHNGIVLSAVFSPDSTKILTASVDSTAKVCDLDGKQLGELKHKDMVNSALFSPNGNQILTASRDGTAKLWILAWTTDGKLKTDLKFFELNHKGPVMSSLFSEDGSYILTASEDGTAKLWDLHGKMIIELKHKGPVHSAVISPNNKWILTASADKTAKLWDLDGKLLADLNKHEGPVYSAVFSSRDGQRILTASSDGTAKVWLTPSAIYKWLKESGIPPLFDEEKKDLGIHK